MIAAHETLPGNTDQARQRAEKSFKQDERAQGGRMATAEYEAKLVPPAKALND